MADVGYIFMLSGISIILLFMIIFPYYMSKKHKPYRLKNRKVSSLTVSSSKTCLECCIGMSSCLYFNSCIGFDFKRHITFEDAIKRYSENIDNLSEDIVEHLEKEPILLAVLETLNLNNPHFFFTILPTGSLRERFGKMMPSTSFLASDFDLMLVPNGVAACCSTKEKCQSETPIVFEAVTERNEIPPGFLWLKLKNKKLDHWKKLCLQRLSGDGKSVERYLSQLAIYDLIRTSIPDNLLIQFFSIIAYDAKGINTSVTRNGPALTIKVKGTNESKNEVELFEGDFTFALHCVQLPKSTKARLEKLEVAFWPPLEVIQKIKTIGCHVVPKPSKKKLSVYNKEQRINSHLSGSSALEFRYSFSQAELLLSDATPQPARQAYMALKALIKQHINNSPDRTERNWGKLHKLPSYVLKTILFRTLEETSIDFWKRKKVLKEFFLILFVNLQQCVQDRKCSMFWIPEINLLADFDDEDFIFFDKRLKLFGANKGKSLKSYLLDDWVEMQRCIRLNCCDFCLVPDRKVVHIAEERSPCSLKCTVPFDYDTYCCGRMEMDESFFDVY